MDSALLQWIHDYWIWLGLTLVLVALVAGTVWWLALRVPPPPKSWAPEDRFLTVGDFRIRYIIEGNGPPLLLLHGIAANLFAWRKLIPLLSSQFQVIALDLPGFGYSTKDPKAGYGLDEQCDRLEKFLDGLGIGRCRVLGSSMGGALALHLARRNPERFWEIICMSPATTRLPLPVRPHHLRWASAGLQYLVTPSLVNSIYKFVVERQDQVDRQVIDEYFRPYQRSPESIRTFLSASQIIHDPRIEENPGLVKVPVLYLWGRQDRVVPLKQLRALERRYSSKIQAAIHPNAGHHIMEDDPEWVSRQCQEFFGHRDF
ncbi:MAG: alpha/beta fold hydrolase [Bdellovibrionales bacterium]|nr:alpha/beta fold hydrolase [Bdellovibrionales bacterium]